MNSNVEKLAFFERAYYKYGRWLDSIELLLMRRERYVFTSI